VRKTILAYTDRVMGWHPDLGVEFYLRDCCFNRGPTGAALILQNAIGAETDGRVGPATRAKAQAMTADALLDRLRVARESYEVRTYGRREQFWKGLTNRWNAALVLAKDISRNNTGLAGDVAAGAVVTTTIGGAIAAAWNNFNWTSVALIVVIGACVAILTRRIWRKQA
jgi:lysozyme family protein